jgi:hypothetical protein
MHSKHERISECRRHNRPLSRVRPSARPPVRVFPCSPDSTANTMRKSLMRAHVCLCARPSMALVAARSTLIDPHTPNTRLISRHMPKYHAILNEARTDAESTTHGHADEQTCSICDVHACVTTAGCRRALV